MVFNIKHHNYVISGGNGELMIDSVVKRVSMLLFSGDYLFIKKRTDSFIEFPIYEIDGDSDYENLLINKIKEDTGMKCYQIINLGVSKTFVNQGTSLMFSNISNQEDINCGNVEKIIINNFENNIMEGLVRDSITVHSYYIAKHKNLISN